MQDIYSHSNSVDNNIPVGDIFELANGSQYQCDSNNNFAPDGLVTGYFSLSGILSGNQCRGMPDGMCCHRELNKDSPSEPNGNQHAAAYSAAEQGTQAFLDSVVEQLNARASSPEQAQQLIKILKKRMRRTAFVIDVSGSMDTEISGVKSYLAGEIANMKTNPEESHKLGLVTFADHVDSTGFSCDLDEILTEVNALEAGGGSGCGEASNRALLSALRDFPRGRSDMYVPGGSIIFASDEPAYNPSLGYQIVQLARQKRIRINTIATVDTSCDQRSAQARSLSAMEMADSIPDPLTSASTYAQYGAIAKETGGIFLGVNKARAEAAIELLMEMDNANRALISEQVINTQATDTLMIVIPVDDSLSDKLQLLFTSDENTEFPDISVEDPAGQLLDISDPQLNPQRLGSANIIEIDSPQVGLWKLHLTGAFEARLQAYSYSALQTQDIRLSSLTNGLNARDGLLILDRIPVSGESLALQIGLSESVSEARLSVRNLQGQVLAQPATVLDTNGRVISATFTVPDEAFLLVAEGNTELGEAFARVAATIEPEHLSLDLLGNEESDLNQRTLVALNQPVLKFEITNGFATAQEIEFNLSGAESVTLEYPATVTIPANQSHTLEVLVTIDRAAEWNKVTTWVATASSVNDPTERQSLVIDVKLVPPVEIIGDEQENVLTGFYNDNTLMGFAENDILSGRGGNDTLLGGEGDDVLHGDSGSDHLYGETGDDELHGGDDDDQYYYQAGDGNDRVFDTQGYDLLNLMNISPSQTLLRRRGNDLLVTFLGSNSSTENSVRINSHFSYTAGQVSAGALEEITFDGGMSWDYQTIFIKAIEGYDADDSIEGHAEDDVINGGNGQDQIDGGRGNDIIHGEAGNDILNDYFGNNQLNGGAGADTIAGSGVLHGNEDNDSLSGRGELYGDSGDDTLTAESASRLDGGADNDQLYGSDGNDQLFGGTGDDILQGDVTPFDYGDNAFTGGPGKDILYGGYGRDTYYYYRGDGEDILTETKIDEAYSNFEASIDSLVFGPNIKTEDVEFYRIGENLELRFSQAGDKITITHWFLGFSNSDQDYFKVNRFVFHDGTIWSDVDVENNIIYLGTPGDDILFGYRDRSETLVGQGGNDQLSGGSGNDILQGGDDDDRYYHHPGDGLDVIIEQHGNDILVLRGGITAFDERIEYLKQDDDLVIRFDQDSQQMIRIKDHFADEANEIELLGHSERAVDDNRFEFDIISMSGIYSRLVDFET
ncbi:calcium-binding protein [Microbulbifer sp. 2304DJ12-6]|uniref:calcium-binding protein n=1 Tax=Microbulbifer sp. 2304DJ12-6 TaxID=3233340 RepID=UPI0039B01EB5